MNAIIFSKRTTKEILRDPLTLFFGLGFPVILLILLSAIQKNVPVSLFEINSLAPAMTIFGLSFMTLFASLLISKDRESSLLQRLYTTPLKPVDFIIGYTIPLLVMAILQATICLFFSLILGLKLTLGILYAILAIIPSSIFFISLGLLFGSILTSKQVGGICGALLTNLTAWLSGIWFDLDLVGGLFKKIAFILPFYHGVEIEKALYSLNFSGLTTHFIFVIGYALVFLLLSIFFFLRQMNKN